MLSVKKIKKYKKYKNNKRLGFTLMEVLVAVAITGLVVTAGFRLIAMSLRLMSELQIERDLISGAQIIWLRFRTEKDMPDNGIDEERNIRWETEHESLPIEEFELKYKKVKVSVGSGNSNNFTYIYVAD